MVGQMQRRFVLGAMLVSIIVTCTIYFVISIENYKIITDSANRLIDIIVENNGEIPEFNENGKYAEDINIETRFSTRYIYVKLDKEGNEVANNINNISKIPSREYSRYIGDVLKLQVDNGYYGNYKYKVIKDSHDNTVVVLIDCTAQLKSFDNFTRRGILVVALGLLFVLILFTAFSKKVISPIVEGIEKQKQFIANAGHELKTPIAVILANSEVLEMTEENEDKLEIINSTKKQAERLNELTGSLLNLAKTEEGVVDTTFEEFSISKLVEDEVLEMKSLAKNKEITCDISDNIMIKGDRSNIKELIIILLDNAIKYSNENGKIEIHIRRQGKNGCKMRFMNTCDNPKSIDTKKIYERFYREDKSRNKKKDGYGIGLSMAKSIVDMHKGKIFTYITKDNYVCFTVIL